LVMFNPDWRPENLPRIRDLVDQQLGILRNTMQGAEEGWVQNPARAYWRQENPLLMTTDSFLTRTHNVQRLRWLLKDPGNQQESEAVSKYLERLATAGAKASRSDLVTLLGSLRGDSPQAGKLSADLKPYLDELENLPPGAKANAIEAAKD